MSGKTLFEKIWDAHVVVEKPGHPAVLYVDLHGLHEVTARQAFQNLAARKLKVARPKLTSGVVDAVVPPVGPLLPMAKPMIKEFEEGCAEHGVECFGTDSVNQGILQVVHPELGLTLPGFTVVNGDSHTSTQGALGALAFGIGSTEVAYVMATQCVLQRPPKTMNIQIEGTLARGVYPKDLALYILAKWGTNVGRGYSIEYTGSTIRSMSMEGRLTLCNLTIELGSRSGLIAPDEVTFDYLRGRLYAPKGERWDEALSYWKTLRSDPDASYDAVIQVNANEVTPMVTYGTTPGMGIPIDGHVPDPADVVDPGKRDTMERALKYMNLQPGESVLGRPVDVVFIGTCTNGRIEDLREAALVLRDRKVSPNLRVLVVPGSQGVKRQAEIEGLDRVFKDAGAEWGQPSCAMCLSVNGVEVGPGQYSISTSNRNFEDRQGPRARTFLASPLTAAASAIEGRVADPRRYLTAVAR